MPIIKNRRPKKKKAPSLKLSKLQTEYKIDYNRLQADMDDEQLCGLLEKHSGTSDPYLAVERILAKFDATVSTLQINTDEHTSYRVMLRYTDRSKKPKHGHIYPSMAVVKTSPRLVHSVMLAYLELCKIADKQL